MTSEPHWKRHGFEVFTRNISYRFPSVFESDYIFKSCTLCEAWHVYSSQSSQFVAKHLTVFKLMQFCRLHDQWNRILLKTLHFWERFQNDPDSVVSRSAPCKRKASPHRFQCSYNWNHVRVNSAIVSCSILFWGSLSFFVLSLVSFTGFYTENEPKSCWKPCWSYTVLRIYLTPTGMLLRAGCQLILPVERELKSSWNFTWKQRLR